MKTTRFILAALTIALFVTPLFVFSSTASALSGAEKRACKSDWDGESAIAGSAKDKRYLNSKCDISEGGNCTRDTARIPLDEGGEQVRASYGCGANQDPDKLPQEAEGCAGIETSIVDCDSVSGGNSNPIVGLLLQIVNFLAVGVGIAVVGGIIWGGMVYASSNGDSNKVQQAKTIIVNSVIGLLLFFFMYALINYLVPGGLFN